MATITRGDRKIKRVPLVTATYATTSYIKMYDSESGDEQSISKADLVTALGASGLGGGSSGSGEIIDCGERMVGDAVINLGSRI